MAVDIANRVSNGLSTALNSFKDVVPSEFHPYFTIAFFIVIITLYLSGDFINLLPRETYLRLIYVSTILLNTLHLRKPLLLPFF